MTCNLDTALRTAKAKFIAGLLPAVVLLVGPQPSYAGSATWRLYPTSSDWNTAANWTPATVPNGPADSAKFATSDQGFVSISADTIVDTIVFRSNASAFVITANAGLTLTIGGGGVMNFSSAPETFDTAVDGAGNNGIIKFDGNATITGPITFNNEGGIVVAGSGGETQFNDFSSAGDAVFINNGPRSENAGGGHTTFYGYSTAAKGTFTNLSGVRYAPAYTIFSDYSSAGHGTFTNQGDYSLVSFYDGSTAAEGTFINSDGGLTQFSGTSGVGTPASGGNGTFINNGATTLDGVPGATIFYNHSDAGNGTYIANPGSNGGRGGVIAFVFGSTGGTSRMMIYGNGSLDISESDGPDVTIGSLEGDGDVFLGDNTLRVGNNNLRTTFSGVLQDGEDYFNSHGSLEKIGAEGLTLTGASTYTGRTIISGGALVVSNTSGSATGPHSVAVNRGALGGKGIIAGAVTVGMGSGAGAFLEPAVLAYPTRLTIRSALEFKADGAYIFKLNAKRATADQVVANGVIIQSEAQFHFNLAANRRLTLGSVFTAISNISATPIAGTFSNLLHGAIVTIGCNTFKADYEGGDGNDLTLTVVP